MNLQFVCIWGKIRSSIWFWNKLLLIATKKKLKTKHALKDLPQLGGNNFGQIFKWNNQINFLRKLNDYWLSKKDFEKKKRFDSFRVHNIVCQVGSELITFLCWIAPTPVTWLTYGFVEELGRSMFLLRLFSLLF